MSLIRYLDISIVLAALPFVVLADLPVAGYAIGAAAWLLTRYGVEVIHSRARMSGDPGKQAALMVVAMFARVSAIVAAVLIARFAFGIDDGIAAAVTVLVAFTVQLLVTLALRGGHGGPRPAAGGPA